MASEGRATLEIRYCVSWGYFWKAASVAAELCDGRIRETNIMLTPVGEGRFEVYLDGKKLYDRKEAGGDKDFLASLREIRKVQSALRDALDAAPAAASH